MDIVALSPGPVRAGPSHSGYASKELTMIIELWMVLAVIGVLRLLFLLSGILYITNRRIGIVEKQFGQMAVKSGFIALKGKAGYQPEVLRGGLHYLIPIQYSVHFAPLVTIPQEPL